MENANPSSILHHKERLWFCGNWKLYKNVSESVALAATLREHLSPSWLDRHDIVIAPSTIALSPVAHCLQGTRIQLAAQDIFLEHHGAWTGQTSAAHAHEVGCRYALIGHSERRQIGDTENDVAGKVRAALQAGLSPVLCVGETAEQHHSAKTFDHLAQQVQNAFSDLGQEAVTKCLVAYEPLWAIGTGTPASPEWAQQVHAFLRKQASLWGRMVAESMRIVYGGSVTRHHIKKLMEQPDVDGVLIGGASLTATSFGDIINEAIS